MQYSANETRCLWGLGAFGFLAINMVFIGALVFNPAWLWEAIVNPISAVFIIEAIVLMFFFAYLLRKWCVSKVPPAMFVLLSLLGSMAFALPIALLWKRDLANSPSRR